MKQQVFTIFDKLAKPNAIFASNTSSLSISDFTDTFIARDRCIGMHFFNPAPKMRLVQIVRTPHTSDETVATCASVAHRMHKEIVIVNKAPRGSPEDPGIPPPDAGRKIPSRPAPQAIVGEGRHGRKAGRGVYDYT